MIYECDNSFCYGFKIENKGSVTKSRIDIKSNYDYFVYENNIYKVFFNESKRFSKNDNYLLYDKLLFDGFFLHQLGTSQTSPFNIIL